MMSRVFVSIFPPNVLVYAAAGIVAYKCLLNRLQRLKMIQRRGLGE
jgi:uncharacterized membrane protein YqaE (UPF0057 family)